MYCEIMLVGNRYEVRVWNSPRDAAQDELDGQSRAVALFQFNTLLAAEHFAATIDDGFDDNDNDDDIE